MEKPAMIELIFTACLFAAPEDCKDVHLSLDDQSVTATACLMSGQPLIAAWPGQHPNWQVIRYRCSPRREARIGI
jgi:hypothetical protein